MKKSKFLAILASLGLSVTLAACTFPGQVMDGDGMVNWNAGETDPVNNGEGENNPDNPDNPDNNPEVNPGNEVDLDAQRELYEAFINGEAKANFEKKINKESAKWNIDEMVEATVAAEDIEDDEDYTSDYSLKYAYIDCGNDGVEELAVNVYVEIKYQGSYCFDATYLMIFKADGDELNCAACKRGAYRDWYELNEYGMYYNYGSGGAALFIESYSFVNADGEYVFDYQLESTFGLTEPMPYPYSLPKAIRERPDMYEESYASDSQYTSLAYNFSDIPEYPDVYDPETGNYNQELSDKWDEEYDNWIGENFFSFTKEDGSYAAPSGIVKKFLDSNKVKYYPIDEVNKMIEEHEASIGLTEEIKKGGEPEWVILRGETVTNESDNIEEVFVGEYYDEYNDPNMQIGIGDDGKFIVQIGIYRLCFMHDGVGTISGDKMEFKCTAEGGEKLEGYITREDDKAIVKFTSSEWEYINAGEEYTYYKHSDEPNIFIPMY